MRQIPEESICFDEKTHTYCKRDGTQLISVTQLLEKHHLSPSYDMVPDEVLQASAYRGTLIHKEIEDFNKEGKIGFTNESSEYADWMNKTGSKCLRSEFRVHNDIVAGRSDRLMEENGQKVIGDVKTTATLHKESVSWQLSIYAYLLGDDEIKRGQAFWFGKDGKLEVVEIRLKPKEEIDRLRDCERNGIMFNPQAPAHEEELRALDEAEGLIKYYDRMKKEATERAEKIKEAMIKAMEENKVYSFENSALKVTYIQPSVRKTIDTKKLKEEEPEIAKKYTKEVPTKASIRVTIKGGEQDVQ